MARVRVRGMSELLRAIEDNTGKYTKIFVNYYGDKNDQGQSWCPDCVRAEPVINQYYNKLTENVLLISCAVGDRQQWKNQDNEFRKHTQTQLMSIPTLVEWATSKRLLEEDCSNEGLVESFFNSK